MKNFINLKRLCTLTLLALFTAFVSAQNKVSGVVSDDQGPLPDVTVSVKDATDKAVTDIDGKYTITVKNQKAMLVFSYIGYQDVAEVVGKRATIDVRMKEDARTLDEAVVIGYGTQQKLHLTGSISKLDGDKLVNAAVSDVTTALQGAMSGLSVNNTTSEVGVVPSIRVRGTGSISAESEPLVIIDGVPISGGLSMVNASDIKSIEILKDAASAAIYGSRAANGVIMITTKSGTPDKPHYAFKFYEGFKYAYRLHDMMTSSEWLDLLQEEEALGGRKTLVNARGAAWLEQQMGSTDWQEEGLRNMAKITNVQFSVSGGKKVSDGRQLISCSTSHLYMWCEGAEGLRPKWGICRYIGEDRSMEDMLRDETVLFADFSIIKSAISGIAAPKVSTCQKPLAYDITGRSVPRNTPCTTSGLVIINGRKHITGGRKHIAKKGF